MFSVFNFSSISRGSVDPICPYVRTPMSRPRCLLSAFSLRKNFLPLWDQQFPSIMRNGSKLRHTVVISLCQFTLVTLFVVFIGTPAAWPDTPGTVLEMTANRFLHSRSFPFPSSSLIPIPLGIPSPWTVVLLATFPLGPFLRLHLLLGSWNSLLAHIGSIDTLSTFKRHLNFHLFQSACTV